MGFSQENGYIPSSIQEIMNAVMRGVNTRFGTSYTAETFVGTNWYKYFYSLAQKYQESEVKTAEIFLKIQEYFIDTNEKISRPNTTHPGIFDYFQSKGYFISTKPPDDADAGKVFICVDVDHEADDYAETKALLCSYVKDCVVAGVISQGTEESDIILENGQSFTFKYNLPTEIPILLKLTITLSENNEFSIASPEESALKLYQNITAKYKLGKNFEPQKYFTVLDAPWASQVLLEYSDDDGETWASSVYDADYDEVLTFDLADIEIVEA